ncbi:MAG: hypothetical protein EP346_14490 [Bacteroidetes bacterium]|uniref:Uncharacterized protein n=1 Tax=Phaeocystidibacter marisrubri TaxID=1577780 RepID=A0A6L3ZK20_9FLAO|nr:hypothetical protein [Phaeocystidibacter marisrubri]KAB2818033.1 hypothetical protein F8C82_06430 [Phaeocystidibacter marisrubri]TNE26127.1 MAG: hypothetical protein EP346_14490 [Bacteroidota bacterium]GGH72290.1 hypothetical protein GCM10011318_16100 [Phaeocystidibacter marisrubri]
MAKKDITPLQLVNKIRENQNNNKSLKSLFASQFLGKMSPDELNGLKKSIDKIMDKQKQQEVDTHIEYLKSLGYKVSK